MDSLVKKNNPPDTLAAIDLGSNSFHMIVANLRDGELHVIDRLKDMVRLASGLDSKNNLTEDAQQRAIASLEKFGQRLRDLPPGSVRAVGTNTLRCAKNSWQFLIEAERVLGHPVDIISGIEEARLIYLGVARSLASDGQHRLVMDIGGGSTEFIIGTDTSPHRKESLHMGCVSMSQKYFPGGKISEKRFNKAVLAAEQELGPIKRAFLSDGWEQAVGASGTLRAVRKVLLAAGWSRGGITRDGLEKLKSALLEYSHTDQLELPELSPERAPVFPGGVAIIYATFKALDIEKMAISDGALREGLLTDLIGRVLHSDSRSNSVNQLAKRYHVDETHSQRIITTLNSWAEELNFKTEASMQWLEWATKLHEIGIAISHNQYHKHSAYIIENTDIAGFSQQEQRLLATLVRAHRRKFPIALFSELPKPWNKSAIPLAVMLRLATLLHRSRHSNPLPIIKPEVSKNTLRISFPSNWLQDNRLTQADLKQEAAYMEAAEIQLIVAEYS